MDPDSKNFGRGSKVIVLLPTHLGPRELTGARDLISHFKLLPHYEFFGKRSLPLSISDTHYLHNVVGDTEIRKGEKMQLDQLTQDTSFSRETSSCIRPFDLDVLREAFQLRETAPVNLSPSDKGTPTIAGKSKSEMKDKEKKEKKHKKHKDKDKEKDKEHKKHKHRHKDRSKDKDKEKKKDKSGHNDPGAEHSKKHEKKRKHDEEDLNGVHKHKKSKHRSSKIDEIGSIKVAG